MSVTSEPLDYGYEEYTSETTEGLSINLEENEQEREVPNESTDKTEKDHP